MNIRDQKTQTVTVPIMNKFTRNEMESTYSSWQTWYYGTLVGGIVMMGYSLSEGAAVKTSNEEKQKNYNQAENAETYTEQQNYIKKGKAAEEEAKTHKKSAETGLYGALGIFAVWTVLYFYEPPNPDGMTMTPLATPESLGIAFRTRF